MEREAGNEEDGSPNDKDRLQRPGSASTTKTKTEVPELTTTIPRVDV